VTLHLPKPMRLIRYLLMGAVFVSSALAHADGDVIDVVLDMDNTLIRTFRFPEEKPIRFLTPGTDPANYTYRILDGAPEFLQALSENPKIRISIFSLGPRNRNHALLKELRLPNGKKAEEVIYRVLSQEDATAVKGAELKDLRKINPDLRRVLIVEDTKDSVLSGQRDHVLWLGNKPKDFPSSLNRNLSIDGVETVGDVSRFVQYRNRLTYAMGSILKVSENTKDPHFSLEKTLVELKESPQRDMSLQRAGVREFHRVNPNYHYTSAIPGVTPVNCVRNTLGLMI
jgi:hypothetical protein